MSQLIKKTFNNQYIVGNQQSVISQDKLEHKNTHQLYIFGNSQKEIMEELTKYSNKYTKESKFKYHQIVIDKNMDKSKTTPGWVVNLNFYDRIAA